MESAINAKSLEVTFDKEIDTEKADIEVEKGSVKVNADDITWNKDHTKAVIEVAGKLTAGEYTVNVNREGADNLSGSVKVEDETVDSVEILSENAVLSSDKEDVTVGYKVENQYGEDITSKTSLTANASGSVVEHGTNESVTASKGEVTIPVNNGNVKEGDSIVLTLVHKSSGSSASKTVKVSAESQLSEIEITDLYNKDGKTLDENTELSKDAFYLLVDGKDQYGKEVKKSAFDDVLVNNTNPLVTGVKSNFETINVDGEDQVALRLEGDVSAGKSNIMLISKASGNNATYEVNVAEGERSDAVSLDVPNLVVENEDLFIPMNVLDKDGEEITDLDTLRKGPGKVSVSGADDNASIDKNSKGEIGIEVPKGSVNKGYLSLAVVSSTGESTVENIEVKEEAEPTVIRGLAEGESSVVLDGRSQEIGLDEMAIEDQYGRVMDDASKNDFVTDNSSKTDGDYKVSVSGDENSNYVGIKNEQDNNIDIFNNNKAEFVYAGENGTEKYTFQLQKYDGSEWNEISNSTQEISFRSTDASEYASYEVEDIGTMFDEDSADKSNNAKYDKDIKVYGVLDDGRKVELEPSEFTVDAPSYLDYDGNGTFELNTSSGDTPSYDEDSNSVDAPVTVTIEATGEQFNQTVKVSKAAPEVDDYKVVDEGEAGNIDSMKAYKDADEVDSVTFTNSLVTDNVDFAFVDNYGVLHTSADGTSTYLDDVQLVANPENPYSGIEVKNNNTNTLTLNNFEDDNKAGITAKVDGVTKEFTLKGDSAVIGSKTVGSKEELTDVASTVNNGDTIQLTSNVDLNGDSLDLDKLVNLDLNGNKLTGDVKITSSEQGEITISSGDISGDLTVDAEKATVNNNANVNSGTVTITDVSNSTWNENVAGNDITVNDSNGMTLELNEGAKDVTIGSNAKDATVNVAKGKSVNSINVESGSTNSIVDNKGTVTDVTADSDLEISGSMPDNEVSGDESDNISGSAKVESVKNSINDKIKSDEKTNFIPKLELNDATLDELKALDSELSSIPGNFGSLKSDIVSFNNLDNASEITEDDFSNFFLEKSGVPNSGIAQAIKNAYTTK